MSRLDDLIQEYCPDGVPFVKIKDYFTRLKGTPITAGKMKEIASEDGEIKIFAGGKTIIDAHEADIPKANITTVPAVLIQSRGVIDFVYYDKPFTFKNEMWAYTHEDITTVKYLYYVLSNDVQYFREKASGMGSLPQISTPVTEEYKVPLPALPVQREIVRILDEFTMLSAELAAELAARKKQYEYYRDMLMVFEDDMEWKPLGELFPFIRNGYVGPIKVFFTDSNHGIRYLEGTNIHDGIISDNEILYVTKEFHEKHIRNMLKSDDILMVQSGHVGECAVVGEKYAGANCHALIIMSNGGACNSRFYSHYFHSYKGFKSLTPAMTGGTVKHVLATKMKNILVPVPSLEVQDKIADILDYLKTICLDISTGLPAEIEARQKQYEYYRDKLLTFKELK